ncbi:saccharopine dehydrogenase [Apibacter sp. HY039]|uniref:saccharopine dehydrogenase n=1 Tax=Apibacter sp. HY039 TaxID=2501476 RepID=UPI000FEC1193|nr:saccharopine dehydrogenase [Apibacter sp. HY039]
MSKRILLVGGSGFIGKKIEKILKQRNPDFHVYIGSRKPEKSNHILIDLDTPETLTQIIKNSIELVVLCTTDKKNVLLEYCINYQISYIDITHPSEQLKLSYELAKNKNINSRIIFSSGWMSGIIGGLINQNSINKIKKINIYIYYSSKDDSGKSSSHFIAENITKKYPVYLDNTKKQIKNFQYPENYEFIILKKKFKTYSFEIPDLYILNHIDQIPTVTSKITFESNMTTLGVALLQKLHVFRLLPLNLRKKIFLSDKKGDQTSFDIVVTKQNDNIETISVQSANGQGDLTAFSTVLHIEKLFSFPSGTYFSHQLYDNFELAKSLQQNTSIKIKIN